MHPESPPITVPEDAFPALNCLQSLVVSSEPHLLNNEISGQIFSTVSASAVAAAAAAAAVVAGIDPVAPIPLSTMEPSFPTLHPHPALPSYPLQMNPFARTDLAARFPLHQFTDQPANDAYPPSSDSCVSSFMTSFPCPAQHAQVVAGPQSIPALPPLAAVSPLPPLAPFIPASSLPLFADSVTSHHDKYGESCTDVKPRTTAAYSTVRVSQQTSHFQYQQQPQEPRRRRRRQQQHELLQPQHPHQYPRQREEAYPDFLLCDPLAPHSSGLSKFHSSCCPAYDERNLHPLSANFCHPSAMAHNHSPSVHLHDGDGPSHAAATQLTSSVLFPSSVPYAHNRSVYDSEPDPVNLPSVITCVETPPNSRATALASELCCAEGDSLRIAGAMQAAEQAYNNAVGLNSSNAIAWYSLGTCLRLRAETTQALTCFRTCIRIFPKYAPALYAVGCLLRDVVKYDQALPYMRAALEADPKMPEAASGLASLLRDLSRTEDAVPYYVLASELAPTAENYANLGNTYKDLNRIEESIVAYRAALAVDPYLTDVFCNMVHSKAIVCDWTNRDAEFAALEVIIDRQLAAFGVAPAGKPVCKEVVATTDIVSESFQPALSTGLEQSVSAFDRLSQAPPDHLRHGSRSCLKSAFGTMGHSVAPGICSDELTSQSNSDRVSQELWSSTANCSDEVQDIINDVLNLDEHHTKLSGLAADPSSSGCAKPFDTVKLGDVADTAAGTAIAAAAASASALQVHVVPSVQPFHALIWPLEPEKFLAITKVFAARAEATVASLPRPAHAWAYPRPPQVRLRVGYVSSDFCNHPFSHLTQSIYGMHYGGAIVECFCYALTPTDGSIWRNRIESECEPGHFRDISDLSVADSASAIAADGIHVLVNCNGYTKGARSELFALRPAPVQVAFMGFPGSLGAPYIDYFLTDKVSSPPELADRMHSEKLLYLPHTYFVNDHKQTSSPGPDAFPCSPLTRSCYGLPDDCFLFCSCNQLYKLDPRTMDSWVRILKRVPNSRLWLLRFPAAAEDNVLAEARARGLGDGRIIFTDCASKEEHVARCGLADLFLDSPTCNAHTGGTDALWSGLPVLTKPGNLLASRVAASLLTAAGLPELIAPTMDAYEDIAVELATNRWLLASIRSRLENSRMSNPLFDTLRWVRNAEYLYMAAWQRFEAGLPPAHIDGIDVYTAESMLRDPPSAPVFYRSLPQPTFA